jgi:anti-sigma factor RsiW
MSPGDAANDQDVPMIGPELDLMAYLDGELEPEKSAEVEAKLKSDPAYAARLRALTAVASFVREEADRIYADAKVDDAFTHAILARTEPIPRTQRSNVIPLSEISPPTSRATRTTKNVVIWAVFGSVAAAAAGLFLYVRSNEARQQKTAATAATTQETVAVKTAAPPSSHHPVPQPIAESSNAVEVEDLEVGQGATVIYTRGAGGQNAVVWIHENEKQ